MGIIQRFADIMASNINALLDNAEDPAKMIDQYLRNIESDLGKVKAETASVMAEETRSKRVLEECKEDIAKMQSYAEKAIMAGNDSDAKQFLTKKNQLTNKESNLQNAYELSAVNSAKMRQMHDKLVNDIGDLQSRREAIKAKVAVAKTQDRVSKIGSSLSGASDSLSAFNRMEAKADKMLDHANALSELNSPAATVGIDNLVSKYNVDARIDDELAALKAKLGK